MKKKMIMIISIIGMLSLLSTSNLLADSLKVVFPTGDPSLDVLAVRAAVADVDLGGTVLLKATNTLGDPTAFNFGQFEYNLNFPPNDPSGGGLMDINNHRVVITRGIVIQGETTVGGQMTTIQNGYQSFTVGGSAAPGGDVTIRGIHFRDAGLAAVVVARVNADYKVTVRDNKFTGRLYNFFNFDVLDKPYWGPMYLWKNGDGIHMQDKTGADVTANYTLDQRKDAWKKAFSYMYHNILNPNVPVVSWFADAILVGAASAPGAVLGPVEITNNYMNMEEESSLPAEFEKVWHETFVIFFMGVKGNALISKNIIKNSTGRDINLLDLTGEATVSENWMETGPLGSYHLSFAPPLLSKSAIAAGYRFFFGDSLGFLPVGGSVHIVKNTITTSFPSKDAGGISVFCANSGAWNSVKIEANDITVRDARHGISLVDTGATVGGIKTNGAAVLRNKITGSGLYALTIGNTALNALTADNVFQANNIARFKASASGTSSPLLDPTEVYLDADTRDNVLVGYSGIVIDKGEGNKITGQPRTIRRGVGSEVSTTLQMRHEQ
jgi:hypothetical protein